MSDYRPPVDDIVFVLEHVVGYRELAELPEFAHADLDTVRELLTEAGALIAETIAPLDRGGDTVGAVWRPDHSVTTAPGWKEAYAAFRDGGWPSLPFPEEHEGGGFPYVVGLVLQEILDSASLAFSLGPLLTQGAIEAILKAGTPEQKALYLPRMVAGEWTGTMNLTEPQAGSDVGALAARAVPNGDGSYAITGQKIFITYGEHDLVDQKVHLVLARTPGAPEGTRGISCFLVPKFLPNADGSLGERNALRCLGVEHKLGIHGSPTCVMEYDGATGWLLGEENRGMAIMFVMMNTARIGVGVQGIGVAERAFQKAAAYATERIQGAKATGGEPVAIVEHPDVRRMLLEQKATIQGLRAMALLTGGLIDRSRHHPDEAVRVRSEELVGLLTPLVKAFGTDRGVELASQAIQVFGGAGFVEGTGIAQHLRDVRITPIYEGTNGIQAADLVGRKLPVRGGASVAELLAEIGELDAPLAEAGEGFASIRAGLGKALGVLAETSQQLGARLAGGAVDDALAGSVPYLRMFAHVVCAWLLAKSALAAAGTGDAALAEEKLVLARFYAERLLPEAVSLRGAATAGAADLYALDAERLAG